MSMSEYSTSGCSFSADVWFSSFPENLEELLSEIIQDCNLTVVSKVEQEFFPGKTIVYVLSESHFAVHTYPEHNYLSFDIYTCGQKAKPLMAEKVLIRNNKKYGIERFLKRVFYRGVCSDQKEHAPEKFIFTEVELKS